MCCRKIRRAMPGAGGLNRGKLATGMVLPYRRLQFLPPAGGDKTFTEKTTAAAAAADAGVVFYNYGATGINVVELYKGQARDAGGFSRSRRLARARL